MKNTKDEIIDFILDLKGDSEVEINQGCSTITQLGKVLNKAQGFFCCGLEKKLLRRAKDEDIKTKKYFVVDFDVRLDYLKEKGKVLTHKELMIEIQKIIEILEKNNFNDYSYSVMTGNGLHLYFLGEEKEFTPDVYSVGVSVLFESINEVLKDTPYKADSSMRNLGRLSRLPGTLNPRRKAKKIDGNDVVLFDMGEIECYIMKTQKQNSIRFNAIDNLAKLKFEEKIKNQTERENNRFKKTLTSETINLFEEICKIPLNDLFVDDFGVEQKGEYFYTSGKREGVVYFKHENKIYHGGCSLWGWGSEGKVYDTYHYIMGRESLSKSQTFDWFVENYSHIAEIDKKNKKNFIENKKDSSNKNKQKTTDDFVHEETYFTFGLQCIDKRFGMPQIGDLVLLSGFPGSGKTEYAYFMARQNSKQDKVLYFSLELSAESMKKRLSRKSAGIGKYQYQIKNYSNRQEKIMNETKKKLDSFTNIRFIHFQQSPTIDEILDTIKENKDCKKVFIDALGNMGGNNDELIRYAETTKKLRLYVRDNNVCITLIHHMNKPKPNEAFRPGGLAKLRGTQKIVDDCTLICEIFRDQDPELENKKEKATVSILQYKDTLDGVTGQQDIYFHKGEYIEEYNDGVF